MNFWIINCCLAFLFCVLFAGIVIPQILLIAFRKQLFDKPDERKIHHCVVPRLGGIAFKPVVFFSVALLMGFNIVLGNTAFLAAAAHDVRALVFAFCAIMMLYLVGIADDLIGVRYRAKFMVQILCGLLLLLGSVGVTDLHGVLGIQTLPLWIGRPLTVLAVVYIINAINLIDGIDGLASGLASVALVVYGLAFFMLQKYFLSLLSFATLGVLVPFFYYNVFGNARVGRKIFMGDTGSLTIGMMLSFLSLHLMNDASHNDLLSCNPLILAFSPLMIPCFDVARVFLHRLRTRNNPFLPDKNHIHHKLLALGMGQHTVMIVILSLSLVFTWGNIVLSEYLSINWLLLADLGLWIAGNIMLTRFIAKKELSRKKQF